MEKLYNPNPDGYCGDEDNGQTSAWYVFSALGFYPVCPGSNEYALGSPLFKKVTLFLENGKQVTITAENNCRENRYVASMQIDGKNYTKNYLKHADLMKGADIRFSMSPTPNTSRGTSESDFPYSFSRK
jgi:putative alpha-1,2-mannosidase